MGYMPNLNKTVAKKQNCYCFEVCVPVHDLIYHYMIDLNGKYADYFLD